LPIFARTAKILVIYEEGFEPSNASKALELIKARKKISANVKST
jgi:hypothetical protein